MADLIDIEFGDQRLRVPAWATEATLEAVMKYNEITARALNKLVGVSSDGKKTFRVQEHYFKEIVTELQKSKKKQEELVKQNNTIIKDSKTKTSTTRAKDKSASNTATNFDKKMSELSKNYSTSITLVEGSLLYLSKSLIDLNLVIKETSDIYKTMLRGTRRISKVFNTGENSDVTRTSNRQPQRDSKIFRRERRDLSFKSLFTSFVEDLIEKQEKSLPLEFTNEEYMKGVNDLKKAIKAGNTKGLLDQYIKVLNEAVTQVSEGKTPTEQTIKNLEDALNDFSIFNREYTSVTERLLKHYVTDKSLSPTEKSNKQSYEVFKAIVNTQEKLANAVKQTTNGLVSLTGSAMTTGITFSKVTDMVSKIAGAIPILGGILAGVTAVGGAVLEEYMNGLKNLSGVSAGLGYDLLQLTQFSHDAGMTLADFSKLVSENGKAIKALGNSTTSGMVEFSKLSNTLREKSQEFNQFGLTNNEYNEILIQEIELRRKSGMDSKAIYDSVNGSMNDLLYNTSQLAAMTGQDARQMRIKMNESRKNDATLNLAIRLLSENSTVAAENIESFMGIMQRGGDSAIEIGNQMLRSAQFGESFSVVLKNLPEELRSAVVQDIGSFQEVFDFMSDNIKSMPTEEFNAKLASMIAELSNKNLTDEIGRQANIGITGFQKLVEMSSNFAGLNKSVEENAKVAAAAGQAAKDAAWMAIPSELQNTANAIKESILAETLKQLGIDTDATGKVFVEKLRELNSNIENNGLLKTATDTAMSGVGNFISEHPIISSVVGLAGLAGLGGSISTMLKTITTTGSIVANAGKGFLKFAGFNLASTAGPSAAARNMMSFAGAQTGAQTGANLVDDAARIAAGSSTGAQTGANLVDDAARIAAGSSTGAKGGLRLLGKAAVPLTIGLGAYDVYSTLNDDTLNTRQKSEGVGEAIGGTGGALAGMAAGAALGSIVPFIGTAIGGVLGGILGGFGGSAIGGAAGDLVGATITDDVSSTSISNNDLLVEATMTNIWLENLNGIAETIRDDISEIKTSSNIQNNDYMMNALSSSSQNTQTMVMLMSETNALLQRLIRRYDETANN